MRLTITQISSKQESCPWLQRITFEHERRGVEGFLYFCRYYSRKVSARARKRSEQVLRRLPCALMIASVNPVEMVLFVVRRLEYFADRVVQNLAYDEQPF